MMRKRNKKKKKRRRRIDFRIGGGGRRFEEGSATDGSLKDSRQIDTRITSNTAIPQV